VRGAASSARSVGRLTLPCAALLAVLAGCDNGNRLYREGEYRKAAEEYAKVLAKGDRSPELRYNLGTALLRLEAYDSARAHLEAALPAGAPEVRQRASYNAGNTDLVPVFLQRVPDDQRRPRLERAVAAYQRALLLRPGDPDAKWNLEIALRLLAQQPPGGGGGGGEDEGGGGEEEGEQQAPEAAEPAPQGAKGMTPSEAERILRGAQRAEAEVQGEKLRREQPRGRVLRDW
jgi:tetratricopeptide (TPR) repeat protein